MNKERLQQAIDVMKRVKASGGKFDMTNWKGYIKSDVRPTEQGMRDCGTPACFAGWLSGSPEWIAAGGAVSYFGVTFPPVPGPHEPEEAVAAFLECDPYVAGQLCGVKDIESSVSETEYVELADEDHGELIELFDFSLYYRATLSNVTIDNVIEKLESLL